MRPTAIRTGGDPEPRRLLGRLAGLPLRPVTARAVIETEDPVSLAFLATDPGWNLRSPGSRSESIPIERVASCGWWLSGSGEHDEILDRLWRHSVAAAGAARRLATEAGRGDIESLSRAALLHRLGLWAVAAVSPALLASLLASPGGSKRREAERELLGISTDRLGRDLAERWGCGSLVAEAAWLHSDYRTDLESLSDDPEAIRIIQRASLWAERTPWAIDGPPSVDPGQPDPRLRLLVAEVQVRCAGGLSDPEATAREEKATRALASLRLQNDRLKRELAGRETFIRAVVDSDPGEAAGDWAERASRAWCEVPGVASARVVWAGTNPETVTAPAAEGRSAPVMLALGRSKAAEVQLWPEPDQTGDFSPANLLVRAWSAWADSVHERERRGLRLDRAITAHRARVERDETTDRHARLDALAEFAAGAGHELNNPLAVILGRAQLLLPKAVDSDSERSLRIIIGQAQRAHRILRDLMYVARPPAPRPRACRPDEIMKNCLRDLKDEADARGVRIALEVRDPIALVTSDPDPLRHAADVLLRNALEATPSGGQIRIQTHRVGDRLRWSVRDSGRGISAEAGHHLFEPFFCGREAGRGLGLGLPRIARFASLVGGELTWRSQPGEGSSFVVTLPIEDVALPPGGEAVEKPASLNPGS